MRSRAAANHRHRDAGLARRTRARRHDDAGGPEPLDLVRRDRVVPVDLELGPELAEVLHQVVGEGVVVVDHQQHQGLPPVRPARSIAAMSARALATHSSCSRSGTES